MSGFRVALGGAQARYGVTPDLTAFGKVIGGGMPVGAVGGPALVMDMMAPLGPVYQAGTLSGNPIAMAAGLATLEVISKPGFFDRLETSMKRLIDGLERRRQRRPASRSARGRRADSAASTCAPTPPHTHAQALDQDNERFQQVLPPDARRRHLPAAVAGRGLLPVVGPHGSRHRSDDRRRRARPQAAGVKPAAVDSQARPAASAAPAAGHGFMTVLVFGCLILLISNGARSSWGLFLPELTQARGWSRETFSLAIAMQNLVWGVGGSFLGALSDKFGAMRTLLLGALLYTAGFLGTVYAATGVELNLTVGLLIGLGIGGTAFGAVFTAIGKLVPPHRRTWAFGIGTAAGSFGQFLFLPFTAWLIRDFGWQAALQVHAALVALILLLAFGIRGDREAGLRASGSGNLREALNEAVRDRNFHLLFWGYFVCGLQVVFIGLHLPAYLTDKGMPLELGAKAIALVGLFNVVGCLSVGWLGMRMSKKWLLTGIYVGPLDRDGGASCCCR